MTTELFLETALGYLGAKSIKYCGPEWGCDPTHGFDCSGFIWHVLKITKFPFDESIRHCSQFFDRFGVLVHEQAARKGDLVFFSRNGFRPTHIGIVLTSTEYLHAPGITDSCVCIDPIKQAEIEIKELERRKDQLYFQNPIGYRRLALPSSTGRWQHII